MKGAGSSLVPGVKAPSGPPQARRAFPAPVIETPLPSFSLPRSAGDRPGDDEPPDLPGFELLLEGRGLDKAPGLTRVGAAKTDLYGFSRFASGKAPAACTFRLEVGPGRPRSLRRGRRRADVRSSRRRPSAGTSASRSSPSPCRTELTPRALRAVEEHLILVVVEVAPEIAAPASGQFLALGAAFDATDDRPRLPHEVLGPAAPMDNTDLAPRLNARRSRASRSYARALVASS
jgi:hypothetical protein